MRTRTRILAGAAIVVAGIAGSQAVDRHHGVPLFVAAVAFGAVVGTWALAVPPTLGIVYGIVYGIVEGYKTNGDNQAGEVALWLFALTLIGLVAVLLGIALRPLAVRA